MVSDTRPNAVRSWSPQKNPPRRASSLPWVPSVATRSTLQSPHVLRRIPWPAAANPPDCPHEAWVSGVLPIEDFEHDPAPIHRDDSPRELGCERNGGDAHACSHSRGRRSSRARAPKPPPTRVVRRARRRNSAVGSSCSTTIPGSGPRAPRAAFILGNPSMCAAIGTTTSERRSTTRAPASSRSTGMRRSRRARRIGFTLRGSRAARNPTGGREFFHGLRLEPIVNRVPSTKRGLATKRVRTFSVEYYNDVAAWTIQGAFAKDVAQPDLDNIQFADGAMSIQLIFTEASEADLPSLKGSSRVAMQCLQRVRQETIPNYSVRLFEVDVAVRDTYTNPSIGWLFRTLRLRRRIAGRDGVRSARAQRRESGPRRHRSHDRWKCFHYRCDISGETLQSLARSTTSHTS